MSTETVEKVKPSSWAKSQPSPNAKRIGHEHCEIGDRVWSESMAGNITEGILEDIDNGTAIVRLDSGTLAAV